jgi:hypothetical protein
MPRGKHLSKAQRRAIKRKLREGQLPQFVAPQYGITPKTCQKYLAAMRGDLRKKMQARGCSNEAIEREVHRVFRHDGCQFLAIELPGRVLKSYYVMEGGEAGARRLRP